ncbi:MAG TPA: cytochrome P450 [Sphingomonas sp.]|nr:cytochrome P450 [Sphingomonas sp.]
MTAEPTGSAEKPISFADPEIHRCPFHAYEELREKAPVYKDPLTGNYVLTRYDDVRKALLNVKALRNRTGLNATRTDPAANAIYAEKGWLPMDTLVSNDPPEHRLYRTLVDKVFTPARVSALEPRIEEIINALIDGFIDEEEIDFLDRFAINLPMFVIAEQLGVEKEHKARFKLWSDVSVEMTSPVLTPERELEIAHLVVEMQQYLAARIERVRARPDDRLISHLANTETDGRLLETRELLSIFHQILVAGNETTTTTLASGMKMLIEQPELAEALHADPALARPFVEEVLRTLSPVQVLFRKAAEDIEIDGVAIPAGAIVEVRYGAANRDPKQYPKPDLIDLRRANAQSHLAFGAGPHLCIGNQLARGELRLAFQALTRRLKDFRASRGEESYHWMTSYIAHGPDRLWMSFDRR